MRPFDAVVGTDDLGLRRVDHVSYRECDDAIAMIMGKLAWDALRPATVAGVGFGFSIVAELPCEGVACVLNQGVSLVITGLVHLQMQLVLLPAGTAVFEMIRGQIIEMRLDEWMSYGT